MSKPLHCHPDRALPADPATRDVARRILAETAALPVISMHGHVEAQLLAADQPFTDPARLLVVPDHYVTRMLVSQGVPLTDLGVVPRDGGATETDPRAIWRRLCEHWHLFRGTPSRYWLEHELVEVFGVDVRPEAATADAIYDRISEVLTGPDFRPLALLDRFRIEVLATTDPATATLDHHHDLARRGYRDRVIPTFRPDAVAHPDRPGWVAEVTELGRISGVDTSSYPGLLEALRERRQAFLDAGGLATDHGHLSAAIQPLDPAEAARIHTAALGGGVDPAQAAAYSANLLFEMARMSSEDGLVMQLHPGVLRDHDRSWAARFGPDQGFDIPVTAEFTRNLRPVLEAFGHRPRFRLVLFTVDETTYSRELAPLAGAYPAVRLGAPWWFLDSPEAMRRFRASAMETAGFYNTTGFVDDTRAFLSIPARHDLSRRIDAGYLAGLVIEHRLAEDEAIDTAIDLAYRLPRRAYAPH